MTFSTLPNLIALAVLVAVFWAISRKETTERLHLWLAGWILVLLHFTAQFLSPSTGQISNLLTAASLDCLVLATIAFLTSVAGIASNWRRQALMVAAIGIPCLAFINGAIWDISNHAFYYVIVAAGAVAPLAVFCKLHTRGRWYAAGVIAGTIASCALTMWAVAVGSSDLGITVILTVLNLAAGALYWKHHGRSSAGVLTTVAGFGLWGLVFPISWLFDNRYPNVQIDAEVWNIPKYLVAVGMILTLLEDQIERSNYLAYHDELTGLPNRRLLDDRLDQALAHARRTGNKVAVLLLDLDHFKDVNDTFGHRIGDMTLQAVVGQLSGRIRESDTLARSGGDEFTLVSEVPDKHGAIALVAALDSALAAPLNVQGLQVRTGLSIGLALYPEDGSDPDQLHAAADKAMYVVKRAGRTPAGNEKSRLDQVISVGVPAGKAQWGGA